MDESKDIALRQLISQDLGLIGDHDDCQEEANLLSLIENRVVELLDRDIDLLFSYMYRLDIKEELIMAVLDKGYPVPAHQALALLILERQKERLITKATIIQKPIEGWDY